MLHYKRACTCVIDRMARPISFEHGSDDTVHSWHQCPIRGEGSRTFNMDSFDSCVVYSRSTRTEDSLVLLRFINWGLWWTPRWSIEGAGKEKIDKIIMKNVMQI